MHDTWNTNTLLIENLTKNPANRAKPERIKRICLKCDREFLARGRFNRICRQCQQLNREIYMD